MAWTIMSQRSVLSINAQVSTLTCLIRYIIVSERQSIPHFHHISSLKKYLTELNSWMTSFFLRHADHGGWSKWSNWTECSVTCGAGVASRERHCISPALAHGGSPCEGRDRDTKSCVTGEVCIGRC